MSSLFGQQAWASITQRTYGYQIGEWVDEDVRFFFAEVENDLGRYRVAPAFGDYVALGGDALGVIERFTASHPERPSKVKFTADAIVSTASKEISQDGFIHTINFESYEQWREVAVQKDFIRMAGQAERRGVHITKHGDLDSVLQFWNMHVDLRVHKFSEIPQPKTFFIELFKQFLERNLGAIYFARDDCNKVIGGVLVVADGLKAYYKFNASRPEFLRLRPNNLLIDFIVEDLSKNGFKSLDLGFTGSSAAYEGLRKFKEYAGGLPMPRYTWRSETFNQLNTMVLEETNTAVRELLSLQPSHEDLNQFAEEHYKKFI